MRHERGNILFLILLAVVLFAALSYAVTQSMRGGGNDASKEKVELLASQIVQYGTMVENAISRLRLTNNCADTQIDLDNSVVTGFDNATAPTDKRCNVFDPAGGGVSWQNPNPEALDTYFSGGVWGPDFGYGITTFPYNIDYVFDTAPRRTDLLMIIPFIRNDVCVAINKKLGLPDVVSANPYIMDQGMKFAGTYVEGYQITFRDPAVNILYARTSACVTGPWAALNPESGKDLNAYVHFMIKR